MSSALPRHGLSSVRLQGTRGRQGYESLGLWLAGSGQEGLNPLVPTSGASSLKLDNRQSLPPFTLPIVTEGPLTETGSSLRRESQGACVLRVVVPGPWFWGLCMFLFLWWERQVGPGREAVV